MRRNLAAILCLLLCGCFSNCYGKYEFHPSAMPSGLAELNTEWDDYNAPAPYGPKMTFVWATNRGSQGKHFDIWTATVQEQFKSKYSLQARDARPLEAIASEGNEFGPFLYPVRAYEFGTPEGIVFASDRLGGTDKLDLYRAVWPDGTPAPIDALNSPANDAYWTSFEGHPAAYFASDRGGTGYDIYEIRWKEGEPRPFGGEGTEIRLCAELSGPADDTAPYLFRLAETTWILFASNRPGGQGGYDLWCSRRDGDRWGAPRNLGAAVNSPSDEFRPSVSHHELLIFSSNRPGGKGGFDLYFAHFTAP